MRYCSMIGCKEQAYNALSLGPGTYADLCQQHYIEEMNNMEVKDTLECLLLEWRNWGKKYGSMIDNKTFTDLMVRTDTLLKETLSNPEK